MTKRWCGSHVYPYLPCSKNESNFLGVITTVFIIADADAGMKLEMCILELLILFYDNSHHITW